MPAGSERRLVTVRPDKEAYTAWVYMAERKLEALLVVEAGVPVGVVTVARLVTALGLDGSDGGRGWEARRSAQTPSDGHEVRRDAA